MFSNFNKTTFGTPASTSTFGFGSGTANATPFGQTQQFGKTTTSTFGTATPLFGATQQQQPSTPLFSNTTFGSTPSSGFGSSLFGQQQPSATNGLFTNTAASTFGQQNKPPPFGFGTSTTSTLFGQQQPPSFQSSTTAGMFGSGSTLGGTVQVGTATKFHPVTGTDTMQKSGLTHSISTKHHCITCMKEYENKSLEELRWEDYQCNRKGPQQQSAFGSTAFGSTAVSSAPSLFGQTSTAPAFGNATAGFGLGNQAGQPSLFGKNTSTFGTPATSSAFGFNTPASNAFGTNNANKAFGAPTTNVFSTPTQQPAFGSNTFFGSTNPQPAANSFFTSKSQPTFNTQLQPSFAFGQNSLFQTPKTTPGFGSTFNQPALTSNAGFTSGTNLFSQPTQNPFTNLQKTAAPTAFGQPAPTGFGLGTQPATNSLFGNAPKPLFGNTPSTNLFGNNNSFSLTQNQPTLGSTAFGGLEQQQQQPEFNKTVSEIYDYFPRREFLFKSNTTYETTDPDELKDIVDGLSPITDTSRTSKLRVVHKLGISSYKSEMQQQHQTQQSGILGEIIEKSFTELPLVLGSVSSGKRLNLNKNKVLLQDETVEKSFTELPVSLGPSNSGKRFNPSKNKVLSQDSPQFDTINNNNNASLSYFASSPSQRFEGSMFKNVQTLNASSSLISPVQNVQNNNSLQNLKELPNTTSPTFVKQINNSINNLNSSISLDKGDSNRSILKVYPKTPETSKDNSGITDTPISGDTAPKERKNKLVKSVTFTDEVDSNNDELVSQIDLLKENVADLSEPSDDESSADTLLCGIKLTRPEYYTIPALSELSKYKDTNGRCFIKGFTVGRTGFGNVYFSDEMDVSNLNLDEIVHFRYREVQVYPNDEEKPPVGQGLNRSAQVTLDNVWPKDLQTQRLIKNPHEIAENNFIDRLCILSEKQNATFLDYRPETGSWVFVVQHFSKYKFSNEDDEETVKMLEAKNLNRAKEAQPPLDCTAANEDTIEVVKRDLGGTNSIDDFHDYDEMRYHSQMSGRSLMSLRDEPPSFHQQQDSIQHQLKYSYAHDPKNASDIYLMKSCLLEEDDYVGNDVSILDMDAENFTLPALSSLSLTEHQPHDLVLKPVVDESPYFSIKLLNSNVPKEKSLLRYRKNYKDMGMFKGQSFKIGWSQGLGLCLTAPQFGNLYSVDQECPSSLVTLIGCQNTISDLRNEIHLEEHLKVVLEGSTVVNENDDIPLFKTEEGFQTLLHHFQKATFHDLEFNSGVNSYFTDTLNLCLVFWGPEAGTPTQRLELFSQWLKDTSRSRVEENLDLSGTSKSNVFKNLFIYLSGHQIDKAAQLAMDSNLPRLATLISQCSSNELARQLMYNQLEEWRKNHVMHFMDKDLMKIYMLLGGIPVIMDTNVCESLDWKRALGVHLWYMIPPGTSLIYGIREYQRAFSEFSSAKEPNPPYNSKSVVSDMYDIQYKIMLLFITRSLNLNGVLNPLTYTSNAFDYRISWLLFEVLTSLRIGTVSQECANYLCTSFATQLEDLGMWKWAIFVLLFIKDSSIKNNAVEGILYRNLNPDRYDDFNLLLEDTLVNDFKLSPKLLHTVLSHKCSTPLESFQHLILAKSWNSAYKLALEKLIPELSLSGQGTELHALLKSLAFGSNDVSTWNKDVGLILEFLDIKEQLIERENELSEFELERYGARLVNLSTLIKEISPTSAEQAVAIKSIC